jgi:hypothetical protein
LKTNRIDDLTVDFAPGGGFADRARNLSRYSQISGRNFLWGHNRLAGASATTVSLVFRWDALIYIQRF